MGVVNITPDSFSDGGEYARPEDALAHALSLFDEGAHVIDLGAESSRPGATPVSADDEWQRLLPVLQALARKGLSAKISIDTRHGETALRAVGEFGVGWVNNIQGLYDPDTLKALARFDHVNYVAMHMHGDPGTMQAAPLKGQDAVRSVSKSFQSYSEQLAKHGFHKDRLFFDPGVGFGKDDSANLKLIGEVSTWGQQHQILVGVSRKSFIGRLLEIPVAKERDSASKMLEFALILLGARVIRTHEVKPLVRLYETYSSESESC